MPPKLKLDNPPPQRWYRFIRGLMEVKNLTVAEFCARTGVQKAAFTRWQAHPHPTGSVVTPETALSISRVFEIPLADVQVAAGFGTYEDYEREPASNFIGDIPNRALIAELESRLRSDDERPRLPNPADDAEGESGSVVVEHRPPRRTRHSPKDGRRRGAGDE